MNKLELERFRQKLEAERAEILRNAALNENGRSDDVNPDRDDLAQDYIEMEQDYALQAMEQEQLEQIESALGRIAEGTYGICENCKEPIPIERLEILPYATLCVRCQAQQERRW